MTKQVALADDTYERLKRARKPDESFSEAIERLLDLQPKDPLGFVARLPKASVSPREQLRRIDADRESGRVDA